MQTSPITCLGSYNLVRVLTILGFKYRYILKIFLLNLNY